MPAARVGNTAGRHIHLASPALPKGLACATCRLRKVRCNGEQPICGACQKTAQFEGKQAEPCVYPGKKARRRATDPIVEDAKLAQPPDSLQSGNTQSVRENDVTKLHPRMQQASCSQAARTDSNSSCSSFGSAVSSNLPTPRNSIGLSDPLVGVCQPQDHSQLQLPPLLPLDASAYFAAMNWTDQTKQDPSQLPYTQAQQPYATAPFSAHGEQQLPHRQYIPYSPLPPLPPLPSQQIEQQQNPNQGQPMFAETLCDSPSNGPSDFALPPLPTSTGFELKLPPSLPPPQWPGLNANASDNHSNTNLRLPALQHQATLGSVPPATPSGGVIDWSSDLLLPSGVVPLTPGFSLDSDHWHMGSSSTGAIPLAKPST